MSLQIRRAVADDWAAVKALRLQALAEAPWAYGSTLEREQDFPEQTWRFRLTSNLTFLAWEHGRLVGTASGYVDPDAAAGSVQLVAMYVEPGTRGTGCANGLIDAVVLAAAADGAQRVLLDVTEVNDAAARCYRRYGFIETGRRHPLPHSPEIAQLEMMLELP